MPMMREIHQSKYSQLIPGINRTDENIRFVRGDKHISEFGDSLPQRVVAEATNAQQTGRYVKLWNDNLNKAAEHSIREAYKARDSKVHQWKELLSKEVDSLAKEVERVQECQRTVLKKKQYFSDLSRMSQMSADFRYRMPCHDSNDGIEKLEKQEMSAISKGSGDMQQLSQDLKECERKLKTARSSLMSEVEAKAMSLNVSRRCQHAEPLLSFPYAASDHPSDQIYHPNKEEEWERNLESKIQNSVAVREEALRTRCRAESEMEVNTSATAEAWNRTSKAILEVVQQDERNLYNVQNLLKTVGENINSTLQRIASLQDDLRVQERGKTLQLWRLQTMTYRPGHEHIRDRPIRKLDEEVLNNERMNAFIHENLNRNRKLLQELEDQKHAQTLEMERLTKKLFIERESCLGLRRSAPVHP